MKNFLSIIIFISLCLLQSLSIAQNNLKKGNTLPYIKIEKLLNSKIENPSFNSLQSRLTIVDFFGTWCIPCVRALPHLTEIKNSLGNDVNVVLVSNETETQLAKFLKARPNVSFPVIVDEGNNWNNAFQPPSLPYTVIINKDGKIVDITTADAITTAGLKALLTETGSGPTTQMNTQKYLPVVNTSMKKSKDSMVQLSQEYMYAAKTAESIVKLSAHLNSINFEKLLQTLQTDNIKKAFWINIYNGYTQATLKANPEAYTNRNAFFKAKKIDIAGKIFSLDGIEHGILRRSKIKWSLGHLNKFFPSSTEKQLRVNKLDYRIHFALNCGAKSCPPIAFYNEETIDKQLDIATKSYLSGEAEYDTVKNVIMLPTIMSWFRADFGGKKGMLKILKKYGIITEQAYPKIKFKKYNWQLYLDKYSN